MEPTRWTPDREYAEWRVVWFPPGVTRSTRRARDRRQAEAIAAEPEVVRWHPLVEFRMVAVSDWQPGG